MRSLSALWRVRRPAGLGCAKRTIGRTVGMCFGSGSRPVRAASQMKACVPAEAVLASLACAPMEGGRCYPAWAVLAASVAEKGERGRILCFRQDGTDIVRQRRARGLGFGKDGKRWMSMRLLFQARRWRMPRQVRKTGGAHANALAFC